MNIKKKKRIAEQKLKAAKDKKIRREEALLRAHEQVRRLTAASLTGKFKTWRPTYETLLGELRQGNLVLIRSRCREAHVNSPVISSAVSELTSLVVARGIQVEFKHPTMRHRERANKLWEEWIESKNFSSEQEQDFYSMQRLLMDEICVAGEVFVKKNMEDAAFEAGKIPISYQLLPADQLADDSGALNPENLPEEMRKDVVFIRGIYYNKRGVKVGYIFFKDDYSDANLNRFPFITRTGREFVDSDQIHHVYNRKEIRYRRGWPLIGTAIVYGYLSKLHDEAELTKQVIASMFAGFIHDNSAEFSLEGPKSDGDDEGAEDDFDYDAELAAGTLYKLPTGKDIKFSDAPENKGYVDFNTAIERKIAGSTGVPYESLASNHSDANYSAARQSQLSSDRRLDPMREELIIKQFIKPVVEDFISYLKAMAILPTEGLTYDYFRPGKIIIDPAKEIRPKAEEVRSGFKSWSQVIRERGQNPRKVAEKIKDDYELFDSLGLKLDTDGRETMNNEGQNQNPGRPGQT